MAGGSGSCGVELWLSCGWWFQDTQHAEYEILGTLGTLDALAILRSRLIALISGNQPPEVTLQNSYFRK